MNTLRPHPLFPMLSLVLLLGVGACSGGSAPEAAPVEESNPAEISASTELATTGAFREVVQTLGSVVPRPEAVAAISAPVAARITAVFVVPGQPIAIGDPLAEIDRVALEAEVNRANAVVTSAELAQTRAARLVQQGILPRRELEQADADLAQAQAALTTGRRVLDLATIKSPIAGIVTRVTAVVGSISDPAVPLVEVTDPGKLDLLLSVSPEVASRIRTGMSMILLGSESIADTLGTATVSQIAGTMDPMTRGVSIFAHTGRLTRTLRIGETVVGEILLGTRPHAVLVPISALVPVDEGFQVFVVDSTDVAHAREVIVGGRNTAMASITKGVTAGERVVTHGAFGMDDGAKVITHPPIKP